MAQLADRWLGKAWFKLGIAIFFAMLQVLQPFIHAHLDADHPIHTTGFHVGADDESDFSTPHHHGVHFATHASHIVSVDEAIKPDIRIGLLAATIGFGFSIVIVTFLALRQPFPPDSTFQYQSLKRRLPATRAPPVS